MTFISWLILIVIVAGGAFNVLIYRWAMRKISVLENIVRPQNDRRNGIQKDLAISDEESGKLAEDSAGASEAYSLYANVTAIFPLLGILGTVSSLMAMSGTENLSDNFASALWTTFAGLIFAIGFKLFDARISSRLDRALDEADYLIREHDKEKRNANAPQTKA